MSDDNIAKIKNWKKWLADNGLMDYADNRHCGNCAGRDNKLCKAYPDPQSPRIHIVFGCPVFDPHPDGHWVKSPVVLSPQVEQALKHAKNPVQRLGQGVHKNIFYFGTSLQYQGNPISAIITSEHQAILGYTEFWYKCQECGTIKKIVVPGNNKPVKPRKCECGSIKVILEQTHNQIKDAFGIEYRTDFNDEAVDYPWQTNAIKEYLERKYISKNIKELFMLLVNINQKYIDHLSPTIHKIIACWIIGTYCFVLFEQFGRLYFLAERGSGKTKQTKILKLSCHNSMWITKGTESSIFRDIEATCGTPLIDNMDKIPEQLRQALEHWIETGWMQDAVYRLTNTDTWKTVKFISYSPGALNNILGLDSNTVDKTIRIDMLRSVNDGIKRLKVTPKSEDWESIRNNLRYWVLDHWSEVQKANAEVTADLIGREYDVYEGVLSIAKLINQETYVEILKFIEDEMEKNKPVDLENNHSYLVFTEIWKNFEKNPVLQQLNCFTSDIAEVLFTRFNPAIAIGTPEYVNRKKGFSRYIAKIIRGVPFFKLGGLSNGRTYITISRDKLKRYMDLQHFFVKDEMKQEEVQISHDNLQTSTTPTISTISTTSTLTNSKQVDEVEQVGQVEQVRGVDNPSRTEIVLEELSLLAKTTNFIVPTGTIIEACKKKKISETETENALRKLSEQGTIFEPQPNNWSILQ